jgi:hypothetical protein
MGNLPGQFVMSFFNMIRWRRVCGGLLLPKAVGDHSAIPSAFPQSIAG